MSAERTDIRVLSALVCDDVRKEQNGKEIIIGVYPGRILVSKMPARLSLVVWLYLEARGPAEFNIEVRGIDPSDRQIFEAKMTIKTTAAHDTSSAVLPRFPLLVQKEGFFETKFRVNQGKWRTIVQKKIELTPQSKLTTN